MYVHYTCVISITAYAKFCLCAKIIKLVECNGNKKVVFNLSHLVDHNYFDLKHRITFRAQGSFASMSEIICLSYLQLCTDSRYNIACTKTCMLSLLKRALANEQRVSEQFLNGTSALCSAMLLKLNRN